MNRAYRYRIYPTTEQRALFAKTFGCCRKVYNLMLSDKIEGYETTGKFPAITPAKYKKDHPYTALRLLTSSWICRLPSVTVSVSRTRRILVFLSSSPQSEAAGLIPPTTRRVLLLSWTAALSGCLRPVK